MHSNLYNVLVTPVTTEKSTNQNSLSKYTFIVTNNSTKINVRSAIKKIFNVDVKKVNIVNIPSKVKIFKSRSGRRSGYKKAIVTLTQGQSIELL